MRIAFFGLPLAAVLLMRDGHRLVYAAACRKAPGLRRLQAALRPSDVHLRPDVSDPRTARQVADAQPDLLVSWFWTTRLPHTILRVAPAVGVHPSLLPRHRGPDPYFWAIDSGDEVTGVTAHVLDGQYDTGAVLLQRELAIDPKWNAWNLARALDRPGLRLLREVVRAHAVGRVPPAVAQDECSATVAPEPLDDDLAIRWSWTAARIERRIRAAAPWPGAWTEIGNRIVTLLHVRPTHLYPRTLEPAEAAVRDDGVAVVRTGDAAVELLAGRIDDDGAPGPRPAEELLDARGLAQWVLRARGARGHR